MVAGGDKKRSLDEHRGATVTLPSDRAIVITRTFDAPRALVFDVWTTAEHIAQWWDPSRAPLASCEVDLRPGGAFRFVPRDPERAKLAFTGRYREISRPTRLVIVTPGPSSGSESVGTLAFDERDGTTTLTITIECASQSDRDALLRMRVDVGTAQTLDNLAEYLRDSRPNATWDIGPRERTS
jgi:uncharacterized protein YndB with AHSA1/START domain